MERQEAIKLLREGRIGVKKWNEKRESFSFFEEIPELRGAYIRKAYLVGADLHGVKLSGANLSKADLSEADLRGADLSRANLRKANLHGADLHGAKLIGADLRVADLRGAKLISANLREADLYRAYLREAYLREADLSSANLHGAKLSGAKLISTDLHGADLGGADLYRAYLLEADLREADLRGANLREADLRGAKLGEADLRGAKLSRAKLSRADLSSVNLHGANLHESELISASLHGADLRSANLSRADLSSVNLHGANLSRADLSSVNLHGANLSRADLSSVNLHGAYLREADLIRAKLYRANLREANLSSADLSHAYLREANLREAYLREVNLSGANLKQCCLVLARVIRCDLRNAAIEGAIVRDTWVYELRGSPIPPEKLWLDLERTAALTGEEAQSFFTMQATVEVYLTDRLTQQEIGCYHFHLGEVHHEGVATGVYLVGHHYEGKGSVLRFQAKTYEEIYEVLGDLLAPFRTTEAADWRTTIEQIPPDQRSEAATALAKIEAGNVSKRWRLAKRMADVFNGYHDTRVYQISEGRSRGIRIDVYTNEEIAARLAQQGLPKPWDGHGKLLITAGDNADIRVGEKHMGDERNIHGDVTGSAIGKGASVNAGDISVYKQSIDASTLDPDLKQKLKEARDAIEQAELSEQDKADANDNLSKLTDEVQKAEPDANRVERLWSFIKDVVPTVGTILKSADTIGKLLG